MRLRQRLQRAPTRFAFDAAVRVLMHAAGSADPARAARFTSPPNLAYPGGEITAVSDNDVLPSVQTSVMGMAGPAGALPRAYTQSVTLANRGRSPSLHAFMDLLAQRFVAFYAHAGAKYRLHRMAETALLERGPDRAGAALLALTGYATGQQARRLVAGEATLQHFAGFFAARPRSADRLAALMSDWFGRPVRVRQFAGTWLALPVAERTALPVGLAQGAFCRLGVDAAAGVRAWDVQARVILVVGPLETEDFHALLPGGAVLSRFVSVARAFLGYETGFAVNLVVRRQAVPPLVLSAAAQGPLLGWNTWLNAPAAWRLSDPDEPLFEAELVEAAQAAAP